MKSILYVIYAVLFYIYNILPLNNNKTTFIMTHDNGVNGNIMCMYRKLKKEQPNHVCRFITKSQLKKGDKLNRIIQSIEFVIITSYHLATSKTIFLDNVFLPMAYIKFKHKVEIIQLWHGCNTLKRFGQLSTEGLLKKLEKKANSKYTHVIVSSKKMISLHQQAFGVNENIIYPLGLPRMDILFDNKKIIEEKKRFFEKHKDLINKRIILYAPTFRDNDLEMKNSNINLSTITKDLPDDFVIITKFHPFVARYSKKIENNKLIDMSIGEDLNRLLLVADILITDYSSVIFEYALLNKPIIFYAYDKDEYENNIRGFYYDYENYVEGKIVYSKYELLKEIINIKNENYDRNKFIDKYIDYKDNKSTDRVYNLIY